MLTFDNARTLAEHFTCATDCQLATLEHLAGRARTPKGELTRQETIARNMIAVMNSFCTVDAPIHLLNSIRSVQARYERLLRHLTPGSKP